MQPPALRTDPFDKNSTQEEAQSRPILSPPRNRLGGPALRNIRSEGTLQLRLISSPPRSRPTELQSSLSPRSTSNGGALALDRIVINSSTPFIQPTAAIPSSPLRASSSINLPSGALSGSPTPAPFNQLPRTSQSPPTAARSTNHNRHPRNFVQGLDDSTNLLDIPCEQIGTLVGVRQSIKFIPGNLTVLVREVYITLLQAIFSAVDEPQAVLAIKKYFLASVILFTNRDNSNADNKTEMKTNAKMILEDQWTFTLGGLHSRQAVTPTDRTEEQTKCSIDECFKAARISRAYELWVKPQKSMPQLGAAYEGLVALFPPPIPHPAGLEASADFELDASLAPRVTEEMLADIIFKKKKLVAHGFDHVRSEFWQQLWGRDDNNPQQAELRKLYTSWINLVMYDRLPEEVRPFIVDTEAFAVPKSNGAVRPLGKPNSDRKTAATALLKAHAPQIRNEFKGTQYGCDFNGTEKIIQAVKAALEANKTFDFFAPDGVNAFNNCNRRTALEEIKNRIPTMLAFAMRLYGGDSNTWFFGLDDGIRNIPSREGSQQGCNLGNFMCAMAYISFVLMIIFILAGRGFAKFFVDDGNLVTSFEKMLEVIAYMAESGKQFGYILHFGKGIYLLGKTGSLDIALERKRQLIALGFAPDIIKIHPDDVESASEEDIANLGLISIEHVRCSYGGKALGGFIGHDDYILEQLRIKATELEAESHRLIELDDPQECMLFLKHCFANKANHILRTTHPRLTQEFAARFDHAQKRIFCHVLGGQHTADTLPDWLWTQCCFSLADGGIGLHDSSRIAHAAFVASSFDCWSEIEETCSDIAQMDIPFTRALHDSLAFISREASTENVPVHLDPESVLVLKNKHGSKGLQHELSQLMSDASRKRFVAFLASTPKHLAWFNSVSSDFASRFLNVLPKGSTFTFEPKEYRVLLNLRLYLDQPDLILGTRCDCKRRGGSHPLIDPKCHHCITACNKTAMGLVTHNAVLGAISDCARAAGLQTKKEEHGLFERDYNGELTDKEKRMRADLTVRGVSGPNNTVVLDVSVASLFPTTGQGPYSLEQANTPELAASVRFSTKIAKYDHAAKTRGLKFQPIIIENSGRMHAKSLKVIESFVKNMSGYKDGALLKRYWISRISCAFQQSVARHITEKLRKQQGQRFVRGYYENRVDYALDYEATLNNAC